MKEYKSIILNGYTTKNKLDALLEEYTKQGFVLNCTIMGNIIIMEREIWEQLPEINDYIKETY